MKWKSINGRYSVSELGDVKDTYTSRILSPYMTGKYRNYQAVSLKIDGKWKQYKIHRLVAQAFIPNPDSKPQVNHIDGNTCNNNVNNLEWCTNRENQIHAWKNGLNHRTEKSTNPPHKYGSKTNNSKLTEQNVVEIKMMLLDGRLSCACIADLDNVDRHTIYSIRNGRTWSQVKVVKEDI